MTPRLLRDRRGAAAVEFALVIPVFLMLFWLMFEGGRLMWLRNGMIHAVGQGARAATLWPLRTNDELIYVTYNAAATIPVAQRPLPVITSGTANGQTYVDVTLTYTTRVRFLFMPQDVTLSETRRAYRPA